MSYILQALAKQKPSDDELLNSENNNGSKQAHHHVMPVEQGNNHALGWGILLTLAILGSLLLGYWFGQQSELNDANSAPLNISTFQEPTQQTALEPAQQKTVTPKKIATTANTSEITTANPNEKTTGTLLPVPADTSVKKPLAAEQYFENPPVAVKQATAEVVKLPDSPSMQKIISSEPSALQKTVKRKEFTVEAVDGVSNSLLARFQSAIEDTAEDSTGIANSNSKKNKEQVNVRTLSEMPPWVQQGVPSLNFDMHIYASDGNGWVKVNGRDRYENDQIAEHLILEEIQPQQVILSYQGEKFSLPALTNW